MTHTKKKSNNTDTLHTGWWWVLSRMIISWPDSARVFAKNPRPSFWRQPERTTGIAKKKKKKNFFFIITLLYSPLFWLAPHIGRGSFVTFVFHKKKKKFPSGVVGRVSYCNMHYKKTAALIFAWLFVGYTHAGLSWCILLSWVIRSLCVLAPSFDKKKKKAREQEGDK